MNHFANVNFQIHCVTAVPTRTTLRVIDIKNIPLWKLFILSFQGKPHPPELHLFISPLLTWDGFGVSHTAKEGFPRVIALGLSPKKNCWMMYSLMPLMCIILPVLSCLYIYDTRCFFSMPQRKEDNVLCTCKNWGLTDGAMGVSSIGKWRRRAGRQCACCKHVDLYRGHHSRHTVTDY